MSALEQGLEYLATRGSERGAAVLVDRLERELSSPDAAPGPGMVSRPARRPLGWRPGLAIALAASVIVLLVAALSLIVSNLVRDPSPDVVTPSVTTTIPPDDALSPSIFDGVVLAGTDSIGVVGGGDEDSLVTDECCVITAIGDLAGGVVYQRDETAILWVTAAGAGPEGPIVVAQAAAEERISLQGVASIGGEATLVVLRFSTTGDGDEVAILENVGLESGLSIEVVVLGGGGREVDRVSFGGGRYLISIRDGDGTWFEFRDESGAEIDVAANPRATPADTLVGQGVLREDGSAMIYIERQPEDAGGGLADMVTLDLERGVELSRDHIANFGDRIVAFDGDRVVIARQRANPELPPVMVAVHLREGATLSDGSFTQSGP